MLQECVFWACNCHLPTHGWCSVERKLEGHTRPLESGFEFLLFTVERVGLIPSPTNKHLLHGCSSAVAERTDMADLVSVGPLKDKLSLMPSCNVH
jgi:hypothetical protein